MTPQEADEYQNWTALDGATAWHLIERHADNWNEVGEMMDAWLRARTKTATMVERERCAMLVETAGAYTEWNEDAVDLAAWIRTGEG